MQFQLIMNKVHNITEMKIVPWFGLVSDENRGRFKN